MSKLVINRNVLRFQLVPRSMTLDDLNSISLNFQRISRDFADFGRNNSYTYEYVSDNVLSASNLSNFWHAFASRGFVSDSWAFLLFYIKS